MKREMAELFVEDGQIVGLSGLDLVAREQDRTYLQWLLSQSLDTINRQALGQGLGPPYLTQIEISTALGPNIWGRWDRRTHHLVLRINEDGSLPVSLSFTVAHEICHVFTEAISISQSFVDLANFTELIANEFVCQKFATAALDLFLLNGQEQTAIIEESLNGLYVIQARSFAALEDGLTAYRQQGLTLAPFMVEKGSPAEEEGAIYLMSLAHTYLCDLSRSLGICAQTGDLGTVARPPTRALSSLLRKYVAAVLREQPLGSPLPAVEEYTAFVENLTEPVFSVIYDMIVKLYGHAK